MKRFMFVFVLVLIMACLAQAKTVNYTLKWDANSEADLAGYKVYQSTISGKYTVPVKVMAGTPASPVYEGVVTDDSDKVVTYYFVVTAYDTGGLESDYSNEVSMVVDSRIPPAPPKNLTWFERLIAWFKKTLGIAHRA